MKLDLAIRQHLEFKGRDDNIHLLQRRMVVLDFPFS